MVSFQCTTCSNDRIYLEALRKEKCTIEAEVVISFLCQLRHSGYEGPSALLFDARTLDMRFTTIGTGKPYK